MNRIFRMGSAKAWNFVSGLLRILSILFILSTQPERSVHSIGINADKQRTG
jgi:hypothetical protein